MKSHFLLVLLLASTYSCLAQPVDPLNPAVFCERLEDSLQLVTLDDIVGTRTILWIICTADSNALPQIWPRSFPDTGATRVANPSTYRMPSWADMVFDTTDRNSLSSFYRVQSSNRFTVTGKVVGQDSVTVFKCDPDTSVRPRHTSQSGGINFFRNIMQKVDSVVNYADYLSSPTATTGPCIFFNIYGLSEGCFSETGGQWPMPASPSTNDTNALGQRIILSAGNGVVFWSTSEQALSSHSPCGGAPDSVSAAYWINAKAYLKNI